MTERGRGRDSQLRRRPDHLRERCSRAELAESGMGGVAPCQQFELSRAPSRAGDDRIWAVARGRAAISNTSGTGALAADGAPAGEHGHAAAHAPRVADAAAEHVFGPSHGPEGRVRRKGRRFQSRTVAVAVAASSSRLSLHARCRTSHRISDILHLLVVSLSRRLVPVPVRLEVLLVLLSLPPVVSVLPNALTCVRLCSCGMARSLA